jgi:hypothetical protein
MRMPPLLAGLALLALAGCTTPSAKPGPAFAAGPGSDILPEQAVMRAAADPSGVAGTFRLTVQATGHQNGRFFINSEKDYRDQRNLTIAVSLTDYRLLNLRFGRSADTALPGKTITVRGVAKRVQIYFFAGGQRTDKYYYQTHVTLGSADDLLVVG